MFDRKARRLKKAGSGQDYPRPGLGGGGGGGGGPRKVEDVPGRSRGQELADCYRKRRPGPVWATDEVRGGRGPETTLLRNGGADRVCGLWGPSAGTEPFWPPWWKTDFIEGLARFRVFCRGGRGYRGTGGRPGIFFEGGGRGPPADPGQPRGRDIQASGVWPIRRGGMICEGGGSGWPGVGGPRGGPDGARVGHSGLDWGRAEGWGQKKGVPTGGTARNQSFAPSRG